VDAAPKDSGDTRVWKLKYETAMRSIETGDIAGARRVLAELSREAPYEEIRAEAAHKLEQFRADWLAWAFFGGTLLVLVLIVLKYVL